VDSHVGGGLWWPADEPWPACPGPHLEERETEITPEVVERILAKGPTDDPWRRIHEEFPYLILFGNDNGREIVLHHVLVDEAEPSPMIVVAQLRVTDIADLHCPPGTDMLQVLWCPSRHTEDLHPRLDVRWRTFDPSAKVMPMPPAQPTGPVDETFLVRSCVLNPERVTEYPCARTLPEELGRRIEDWDDAVPFGQPTFFEVSIARGWKVGGYPSWDSTDAERFVCPECEAEMELVLTVDSTEPQHGVWRPAEDRQLSWPDPALQEAEYPTGVNVARTGRLRLFVCLCCPDAPWQTSYQAE
jgi:hypothetical protein